MFLDWMNGIPIVGHAKGLVHYFVGDTEGGFNAVTRSTRTAVVMVGGAVGCIDGPVGAIAVGTSAGALWDSFQSVVTGENTGLVATAERIGDNVSRGEVPYQGICEAAVCLVGDAAGACGGASLLSSFSQSAVTTSGKSIAESAVKETENAVFKTGLHYISERASHQPNHTTTVCETVPPPRLNPPEEPQQDRAAGGGGQQPPGQNPNNNHNEPPLQEQTEMQEFLDLFEVESLDDISIRGRHIFQRLTRNQKSYLKKIIRILYRKGILRRVIETLKSIFNSVDLEDVSFTNFLSLVEIISQYIGERAARINERRRERQDFPDSYNERRTESIRIACDEILPYDYTIVRVFRSIKDMIMIESQGLSINFRDMFAAVYHYYKHRCVGQVELSVNEYYNLLKINEEVIMTTNEYEELRDGGTIVFERYYEVYNTIFRIVITKRDGGVILCTGFFLDDYDGTDQVFNMYINGRGF